jgi:hypothetical protein
MVMKVELLEDYKENGKWYVHVNDPQDQWAPTSVNRQRIYRKPLSKSDADNMQFFIVRDDLGNETNIKRSRRWRKAEWRCSAALLTAASALE